MILFFIDRPRDDEVVMSWKDIFEADPINRNKQSTSRDDSPRPRIAHRPEATESNGMRPQNAGSCLLSSESSPPSFQVILIDNIH